MSTCAVLLLYAAVTYGEHSSTEVGSPSPMDICTLHFEVVEAHDDALQVVRLHLDAATAQGITTLHEAETPFVGRKLTIQEPFLLDLSPDSRTSEILHRIDVGACSADDLHEVGRQLWKALLPGKIGRIVEALRAKASAESNLLCFRLELVPNLTRLPWEALYDDETGFISTLRNHAILRHPPQEIPVPSRRHLADKLRVLVVIPEGSFLDVEREWNNIAREFQSIGDMAPTRLAGRVRPTCLAEKLEHAEYDVVHFIGHGHVNDTGDVTVRFNDENDASGEHWLEAEAFASMFRGTKVRLAFLNCCLGADASDKRSLSGLGPYLHRAGVPAVVAMRYEIPDLIAVRFSREFYKALLTGSTCGRIDLAVQKARNIVHLSQKIDQVRGFVTPVLFLAPGAEQLLDGAVPDAGAAGEAPVLPQGGLPLIGKLGILLVAVVIGGAILWLVIRPNHGSSAVQQLVTSQSTTSVSVPAPAPSIPEPKPVVSPSNTPILSSGSAFVKTAPPKNGKAPLRPQSDASDSCYKDGVYKSQDARCQE